MNGCHLSTLEREVLPVLLTLTSCSLDRAVSGRENLVSVGNTDG